MLCPKVRDFPIPKTSTYIKRNVTFDELKEVLNQNELYENIFITIPDELFVPDCIEESLTVDREYYEVSDCPLTTFLAEEFIDKFVGKGSLRCLSVGGRSVHDNLVHVARDTLTVHVCAHDYHGMGMDGIRKRNNYYEVSIPLNGRVPPRVERCIGKLGTFRLYVTWEPHDEAICPSSIAKYLCDQHIAVAVRNPKRSRLTSPNICGMPSLQRVQPSQLLQWLGMLWHGCDLNPQHPFVSTYSAPECDMECSRLAMSHASGCFTPTAIACLWTQLQHHLSTKLAPNYWCAFTVHNFKHSIYGNTKEFRAHSSSTSVFLGHNANVLYKESLLLQ